MRPQFIGRFWQLWNRVHRAAFYPVIDSSNGFYFDDFHLTTEGAAMYFHLGRKELQKVVDRKMS